MDNQSYAQFDEIRIERQNGFNGITLPIMVRIPDTMAATAANYTAPFFIANRSYEIVSVIERHETKGSSTPTLQIKKVTSGTAPASGVNVLTAGLDIGSTSANNTNQSGAVTTTITNKRLAVGDALSLVTSGTMTAVAGVTVSVLLKAI